MWEELSLLGFIFLLSFLVPTHIDWVSCYFKYNLKYQNYQYSKLWLRYIFPQQAGKCLKSRLHASEQSLQLHFFNSDTRILVTMT